MSTNPPIIFREQKIGINPVEEEDIPHHHSRLPVIPDLRFEYSYLRSIQPYVKIQGLVVAAHTLSDDDEALRVQGCEKADIHDKGKRRGTTSGDEIPTSEVIEVEWGKVFWITTRDQVITPLLQGALWALASYYFTPFSSQLGSKIGTFVHSHSLPKEGLGIAWLRDWFRNIGLVRRADNNTSWR